MKRINDQKHIINTDNSFGPDCVQGLSEGLKVNTSLKALILQSKENEQIDFLCWKQYFYMNR